MSVTGRQPQQPQRRSTALPSSVRQRPSAPAGSGRPPQGERRRALPRSARIGLTAAVAIALTALLVMAANAVMGIVPSLDPTIPERSWSTTSMPVRYREESADARQDIEPVEELANDESRTAWYHYAPTSDGGIRVFFPASDSCLYRLIVRETSQYVGITVVSGSVTPGFCKPAGDSGILDRYSSMHVRLSAPLADRKAVELDDLAFSAAFPDTPGDGPHFTALATDVSAIPEVIQALQPDGDLLFVGGAAYARMDAQLTAEQIADTLGNPTRAIGTVGRTVGSHDYLRDWDATKLPAGTQLYATTEHRPSVICANVGCTAAYQRMVEG